MRILVVGAGIAGLAVARALELKGLQCDVVERRQASPTTGQSLFLLGNATRALGQLGVLDSIRNASFPIMTQRILSSTGTLLHETATPSTWKDCGPCLAVPRSALIDALLSSLTNVRISYGVSVSSTNIRLDKREVRFSDGQTSAYDLVIGADGIGSELRSMVFGKGVRSLNLSCWRMIVDNPNNIDAWTAMLGKKRTLLAIPLSERKLYLYADCSTNEFANGHIEVLKGLFREFGDPLGSTVAAIDHSVNIHRAKLEEVPAAPWLADRLTLIGDASHASSPSMAQGAAMALEDALVLADLLNGDTVNHNLRMFHDKRKSRVDWVQRQSQARDRLRSGPELVRGLLLRHFGAALYERSYRPLAQAL